MYSHAQTTKDLIQLLMKVIYPSIRYQFLMVIWKGDFMQEDKTSGSEDVLNNLSSEFNSLFTYETKLVFPVVLRVFDKESDSLLNTEANVHELIELTQKKEKRIRQLLSDLKDSLAADAKRSQPIDLLIETFEKEFFPVKENWNNILGSYKAKKV